MQITLARDEQRLEAFIEALPAAVFVTDGQGKPIYSNALSRQLLGEGIGEAFVAGSTQKYPTDAMPLVRARDGISSSVDDMEIAGPTGRVPFEVHGAPLFDAEGKVAFAIAVFRDITSRRALEARLLISERLASVGALAAGVAHEINNPLTYVVSNLAFALDELTQGLPNVDEVSAALAEAQGGAERVRLIVRDLKVFSRQDEDKLGPVDARAVLETALNMASTEIRHRATLVKVFGPMPLALANESRLGQVFLNLLINAAQAIAEGAISANEIRVVTSTDAKGRAVIEITDSGSGIPKEVAPLIFAPFFSTKSDSGGTGLGLTISHGIVQRLGGELTFETEVGKGTTFRVALAAASEPVDAAVSGPVASTVEQSFRVLVIDDEPMIGALFKRVLPNHQITFLEDARQAVAQLRAGAQFDLVLSDLMMPLMSGMELHAELVKMGSTHADRMVFLTGGAFSARARAFLDDVHNLRVEKPFDVQMLRALVARCCAEATADRS